LGQILFRQMVVEHVGWLDDVVIDADQDHVFFVHRYSFPTPAATGRKTGTTKPSSSSRKAMVSSMSAQRFSGAGQSSRTVINRGPSARSAMATIYGVRVSKGAAF